MANLKLSPPWYAYFNKIKALFSKDPEIEIEFDEANYTIKLYVKNLKKADALKTLLPAEKPISNIVVKTIVYPANNMDEGVVNLFEEAFKGNGAFSFTSTGADPITSNFNYVVFKPDVVQFFNDDLTDVHGNYTALYEDIAREVFGTNKNVYFCTDDAREIKCN